MSIVRRLKNPALDWPWDSDTRSVVSVGLPSTCVSEQPVEQAASRLLGAMLNALCPLLDSVLTVVSETLLRP